MQILARRPFGGSGSHSLLTVYRSLIWDWLTRNKILAVRALLVKTLEFAKENLPSRVYSKDLIELLFHQPYTKAQFLVDAGIVKRQAAADYLKKLAELGVLSVHKVGKENLYLNKELFETLSK